MAVNVLIMEDISCNDIISLPVPVAARSKA